jgi:hypothetical protein
MKDRLIPLDEYINQGRLNKYDVENLYFMVVENKCPYLKAFYKKSLEIPESELCDEYTMDDEYRNHLKPKYKNIIRNLFFREILLETETDLKNLKPFLKVTIDMFKYLELDYKLVTPSGLTHIDKGQISNILSGYYFRASIMNPYLVYSLAENELKPKFCFTPTLGWCSYLYGLLCSSQLKHYVGIDVIPRVCEVAKNLIQVVPVKNKSLKEHIDIDIFCKPSEDFLKDTKFLTTYKKYFDTIFFSPPYYRLELYSGKDQSTERYKSYEEWLEFYWHNTIKLCSIVSKKNCKLCYIVSNYNNNSITDDMNEITSKYFKYEKTIKLGNSRVNNTTHNSKGENIYFFKK